MRKLEGLKGGFNMVKLRLWYKLFLRRFRLIPSFCKICGRDVCDFCVDDEIWNQVKPYIKHGNVLCYNCFCNLYRKVTNKPVVWKLIPLDGS